MDVFSSEKRSQVMAKIRSKDTAPEMVLRKRLFAEGFRFRLHDDRLPGKPDIVLPKYRAVIQVRGCFWHGHTCHDGHLPKSNQDYWVGKLARNRARDADVEAAIATLGWRVFVVWECEARAPIAGLMHALRHP